MRRCLVVVLLAAITLLGPAGQAAAFDDVTVDHPYGAAIAELSERGVISGYGDGTFGPDNAVSRQQFAKMIVRTLGLPVTGTEECRFGDVQEQVGDDPFFPSKYIAVCADHEITKGKTERDFAPGDSITRQQLITMVARAAGLPAAPAGSSFSFGPGQFYPPEHYENAVRAAHGGLLDGLQGIGPGFDFSAGSSRGECAQLLWNLCRVVGDRPPEGPSAPEGDLRIHYLDVGQGDSILIISPEGRVMLIDGGEVGCGIVARLKERGVERVDVMVATHPHADHIGGLVEVLGALPVSEVVTNGACTTTRVYERFLDAIADAGAVYREVVRGDALRLGSLALKVLNAEADGRDLNEGSMVLRLGFGQVAFLFMGDAGVEAERRMLSAGEDLRAQILKVGHHGSRSGSSSEFLSAVRPEVAVYSCGFGNSYEHPHPEAMAALFSAGADVYGTDANGTVLVTSDGASYRVDAQRGGPRAPPTTPTPTTPGGPSIPGELTLEKVSLTSPAAQNSTAVLTMRTLPGAACTIAVHYKSGPSQAAGLEPKTTGADGLVTWQWKVGVNTTPGVWSIVVTVESGGQKKTLEMPFEVVKR